MHNPPLQDFSHENQRFGSGYVGLVQATVLAEVGHDVVCMDIDQAKIDQLRLGQVHIYEPGLANLVR
ncbi:hypothetical protein CVE36_16950, partial [Pseudomonas syringae pv. actinidiae]|nr:hypothetical protein [Pseudomonas syringae pv. actinidiae]